MDKVGLLSACRPAGTSELRRLRNGARAFPSIRYDRSAVRLRGHPVRWAAAAEAIRTCVTGAEEAGLRRRERGAEGSLLVAICVLLHLMLAVPAFAEERAGTAAGEAGEEETGAFDTETRHIVSVEGARIEYIARTGMLMVAPGEERGPRGRMFFVSYTQAERERPRRPVTFVFNGGPGAAAAYLHLGLMGPKRLAFSRDGRVTDVPRLVDNAQSWLRFSDLVFVDPIGTGFSRAVIPDGKSGSEEDESGAREDRSPFWATDEDLDALGAFIRLYLTRNGRWLAPTVLAGESYGGFRAAALADRLQSDFGISVSGLVMISPALELDLLSLDRFRLMSWISRVPSFAAAARRHERGWVDEDGAEAELLQAVERFAIEELLPGLAKGGTLEGAERAALLSRLADYIGLPRDLVLRYGGKIPSDVFASRLLEGDGHVVSMYDASIRFPAPHPARARYRDPRLARISAAVAAAFNHDVHARLGVKVDLPYKVLNRQVSARWNWQDRRGRRGPPGAAQSLESAFKTVPGLRALLVHGIYDLVTPYFASAYLVNQLDLKPEPHRRLTLRNYEGGHMFYSHAASRKAFYEDARRLYGEIANDTN